MPYSIDQIKSFNSIDLDNFAIRGAKIGINNAKSTGTLYDAGTYVPYKTFIYGTGFVSSGDTTVTSMSFPSPITALDLVIGDTIILRYDTTAIITNIINSGEVIIDTATAFWGAVDTTCFLKDRDYLIEPDVGNNTITSGLAIFTNGSKNVIGTGTDWSLGSNPLASGDAIQLNTYQKYFIIDTVVSDTSCTLTSNFDKITSGSPEAYTAKKWRLGRLAYQYVKQNFTYDNTLAKWKYDATTGSDNIAYPVFTNFIDGITLQFSPALNPTSYPDLMDSNVVLQKTFTQSTDNEMFQYPLPAVPNPEESFELYLNGSLTPKDRFPDGNRDYVISYSQMPNYEYPPAIADRKVANLMFLKGVQNVSLNPADTASGIINFTDASGNSVSGVMPGSEIILIDGTTQTPNTNYVMDLDAGVALASEFKSPEPLVKYIFQPTDFYDCGISIYKNGIPQKVTMPGKITDDVLFEFESGRLKPIDKDNPGPGEEYVVNYYTEGNYVSNEAHSVSSTIDWIRVNNYPVKYQSVILDKNGAFLDEGVDYRVSCQTGRVVFFSPLVAGDSVVVNYSPLIPHQNGLTYEQGRTYCKVYDASSTPVTLSPLAFTFPNPNLIGSVHIQLQTVYNVSKAAYYDTTGASFIGTNVQLVSDSTNLAIGTELTDAIQMSYKFQSEGVEYAPVETINFFVGQGTNYMVLVNQDQTSIMYPGTFTRLTNVDSAGDFYFYDRSSIYDGEDTVVYFDGVAPSDIINPSIYVTDTYTTTWNTIPMPSGIVSGSTDVKFPGVNVSRSFRPGQLMNLGKDYYSIQASQYDSSSRITTVTLGTQTVTDYTDAGVLTLASVSDIPYYVAGDTVLSTADDIISDPLAPVMTLNYNGYATVTKDSTAFSIDTGTVQYSFLDASYLTVGDLASQLYSIPNLFVNTDASSWQTSKISQVSNLVVTKDSTTVINSIPALYLNSNDTTDFTISGGVLTLNNPLVPGQKYDLDYLGLRVLDDSTVTFSGSYFTTLPAKTKVQASMCYDNLDQFYIQVMSERTFLDSVIEPARNEAANQQSGNVGQGGDLPGDEVSGPSAGGLTNNEFNRVDAVIEEKIFSSVFNFFNDRLQSYGDEMLALKGWNLCNNDGLLSSDDASGGSLSINRMFPWSDYTNMEPFKIACLTGQAIPYSVPGPNRPREKKARKRRRVWFHVIPAYTPPAACRATFNPGLTDVTCTTITRGFPSYWTYQLRVGDYIKPLDSTRNYQITAIASDSSLSITPAYAGTAALTSQYIMTSKYPLYDDDGYVGPKALSDIFQDFGLEDNDVFDVQVDGSNQSYTFSNPIIPTTFSSLFPISNYSAYDVSKILSSNLGITMSPQWVFDPDSAFGYENGLVIRADGTHNKICLGHGAAVIKLGFEPDSTYTGNFDNTGNDPEFIYDRAELADCISQLSIVVDTLAVPKIRTCDSSAIDIRNLCIDETRQIYAEMIHLNVEIASTAQLLLEPTMSGYSNALLADATHRKFMADSSAALAYDSSIITDYQGFITPQKWMNDWSSHIDYTNATGYTSFVVSVDPSYDRRILGTGLIDGNAYQPYLQFQDLAVADGTWTDNLGTLGSFSVANDATFHFNSIPMFSLNNTSADYTVALLNTSGINISWAVSSILFSFINYPTIGDVKAAINNIPGLSAYNLPGQDSTLCSYFANVASTPFTNIDLLDSGSTPLLTVYNNYTYNFNYYIDQAGVGIIWDSSQQYYPYTSYSTVLSMKNIINSEIPGLDATGDIVNDSSVSTGFVLTPITAIPPDATIYSGMRPGYINYWTIDDKNLMDRSAFDSSRIAILNDRLAFLDLREAQIRSDVTNEEYLRSSQGCLGNLYSWADNRFNRSAGSSSKVAQVTKQQDTNSSSKEVNLRFIPGGSSQSGQTCNG